MKIDIEKRVIYNCDAATPRQIDLKWIEQNPGQLFNTPLTVKERQMMLNNQRNTSCENNCFAAEDVGAISPRIIRKGYQKTHFDIKTNPSVLDITLGSDCNLTCSYCSKEYSSAWRKDIQDYGDYPILDDNDRFGINDKDKIISKLSQPSKYKTKNYELILQELEPMTPYLDHVYITGGECFLQNNLFSILDTLREVPTVYLFSGLGVSLSRLEKILTKLENYKNVVLKLSCENIGPYLEFNRFGTNWEQYKSKVELITKYNLRYMFHSTLSNLSLFGYNEFIEYYNHSDKTYDFVHKPDYMSAYVMNQSCKDDMIRQFEKSSIPWKNHIIKNLNPEPTTLQIQNLKIFLNEFTKRRNISIIDVYPKSFVNWLDNVV